jgi:hypothetical protein
VETKQIEKVELLIGSADLAAFLGVCAAGGIEVVARFVSDAEGSPAGVPFARDTSAGCLKGKRGSYKKKWSGVQGPGSGGEKKKKNGTGGWTPEAKYRSACAHLKRAGKTPPSFTDWRSSKGL